MKEKKTLQNLQIIAVLGIFVLFFLFSDSARSEFQPGNDMNYARYGHTATKLLDGTVLITGGYSGGNTYYNDTAEIYNPQDGSFTLVGNKMTSPRCLHTATLLPDGRVLICGGADRVGIVSMLDTAEIYGPDSKTFQPVDQRMHSVRENHRAVRLKDGRVFISGGTCGYADVTGSCDLFDPCDNLFTEVGPLSYSRTSHVSVLLDNGNVLIAGGATSAAAREIAEIYQPGIGLRQTGAMNFPRRPMQADLLPDGSVLLTGGKVGYSLPDPWNIVEIYDPGTELFTVTGNLLEWRIVHQSVILPDGRVLITGGFQDDAGHATASTEIYDPVTKTSTPGDGMTTPRSAHCINLLDNGCILVTGGYTIISGQIQPAYASTEINCAFATPEPPCWPQQDKLLASDGFGGACFGMSVSISGDYAIAGASWGNGNVGHSGSAYIFKHSDIPDDPNWYQQVELIASDGAYYDYFGDTVSISGDYAIVGATADDDNGSDTGSAYIFKRDGTTWIQQTKLLALDGVAGDRFGMCVSISGGYAVVGAFCDDDNGADSGSAYIFNRSDIPDDPNWYQQAKLLASDGAAGDYFGLSVSISGDYAIVGGVR